MPESGSAVKLPQNNKTDYLDKIEYSTECFSIMPYKPQKVKGSFRIFHKISVKFSTQSSQEPVIAVPTSVGYGASFHGLSALLTMLNSCANGISVVNIDNGYGAGYLATQINRLAVK